MKAVILAAGEGKRLRPFTETMPKVMLPIANKPIIHHVVDALVQNGITEIIIVVGYKKESIMQHFKNYEKANIQFAIQEKQLGTAHALLQAEHFIDDSFLVLSGDNIIGDVDINKVMNNEHEYVMLIKEHAHPSKYGVVTIKNNRVTNLVKQPRDTVSRLISTGVHKFPASLFNQIHTFAEKGDYSLFSTINYLLQQKKQIVTEKSSLWLDVVYPWDLLAVNDEKLREIQSSTSGVIEKNVHIKGPVVIGENSHIHSGCYLVGPLVIGKNCELGPNTCIFPSTTIGNNVEIRSFTEIRNSLIMDNVTIQSNSYISHSVLGKGSMVGHSFSSLVGNQKRHHQQECMMVKDIGAMIAEDCFIESHVVTHPGIVIGRHCIVSSLKQIHVDIPSGTRVM